ncbi:alpha/beta hydrolase [Aerococcus urinaeequi]|uniref:alpha/beta hydrolase n=1 Tax=Aerococcus urinaeequi TaxID=51665 RepID=UPI003B3A0B3B
MGIISTVGRQRQPKIQPDLRYYEQVKLMKNRYTRRTFPNGEFILKKLPTSDVGGQLDERLVGSIKIHRDPTPVIQYLNDIIEKQYNPFLFLYRRVVGTTLNRDISDGQVTIREYDFPIEERFMHARVFYPDEVQQANELAPVILYLHGGGFIGTTFDTITNTCRGIAYKTGAVVVAFPYSLAPEKPFPHALVDGIAMLGWVRDNAEMLGVDPGKIAIMGDSSGANIAAAMNIYDIESGNQWIKQQILLYPIVNMALKETPGYEWSLDEYDIHDNDEIITFIVKSLGIGVHYINKLYAKNVDLKDPLVSPLFASDKTIQQMPPTIIVTAEYDFLRIESEAYAKRLVTNGVQTSFFRYLGLDHGFVDKIGISPQSEDALNEIGIRFRETFGLGKMTESESM